MTRRKAEIVVRHIISPPVRKCNKGKAWIFKRRGTISRFYRHKQSEDFLLFYSSILYNVAGVFFFLFSSCSPIWWTPQHVQFSPVHCASRSDDLKDAGSCLMRRRRLEPRQMQGSIWHTKNLGLHHLLQSLLFQGFDRARIKLICYKLDIDKKCIQWLAIDQISL